MVNRVLDDGQPVSRVAEELAIRARNELYGAGPQESPQTAANAFIPENLVR